MEKIDQPQAKIDFKNGVDPDILSRLLKDSHLKSFLETLSCPSCFLIKEDIKGCINCGRVFSTDCIQRILETSLKCPNCRGDWNANSHYNPWNLKSLIDEIKKTLKRFEDLSNWEKHSKVMQHFCRECEECFCDDWMYESKHKGHYVWNLEKRFKRYTDEIEAFYSQINSIIEEVAMGQLDYGRFKKDKLQKSLVILNAIKSEVIKLIDREIENISALLNQHAKVTEEYFSNIRNIIKALKEAVPYHTKVSDVKDWKVPLQEILRISGLKVFNCYSHKIIYL